MDGIVWIVADITPSSLTLLSRPATISGSITPVRTPLIFFQGAVGAPTGRADAIMRISGIGTATSNPSNFATW